MADELTPRILRTYDDTRYDQDTGAVRYVRRVEFKLGTFGPFHWETPRDQFTDYALRGEMDRVASTLRPFTS